MISRALILSAGQGKRMLPLTEQRPKCLLPFNGRTLLEWQMASLAMNGIRDITVVTGFHAEAVEALLRARPYDGLQVRTVFNPFFEVADNVGSCYMARDMMKSDGFVLVNGDTLFHPDLLADAMAQADGPITVTVDRKARYDADDMKVHDDGHVLLHIGKDLPPESSDAESIGMLFFDAAGGVLFASALENALHNPAFLRRWYLSIIDGLAHEIPVHIASIQGLPWCEIDYPKDVSAGIRLTAKIRRDNIVPVNDARPSLQSRVVM